MCYSKQGAKPDQYFNVLEAELEDAGHVVAEVVRTTNPLGGPDDGLVATGGNGRAAATP